MSLNDKINNYLNSDNFKEKVKQHTGLDIKGNSATINIYASRETAERYAAEIKNDLAHAIAMVPSMNFVDRMLDMYDVGVRFENGVGWVIELWFDEDAAFSPSLIPEWYDEVYLPILFNNGWEAQNYVRGTWVSKGVRIKSLIKRKGAGFIQKAVDAFNKRHVGTNVKASYNPVYDRGADDDGDDWYMSLYGDDWAY